MTTGALVDHGPPAVPDADPGALVLPATVERVLGNGLTVIAAQRRTSPLIELRLRIPFACADPATATVLSQTLLAGTATMTRQDILAEVREIGGELYAMADVDRLLVAASAFAGELPRLLALVAEFLAGAAHPPDAVIAERERLAALTRLARTQPGMVADEALNRRIYPDHPYGASPAAAEIRAVTPAAVAGLHAQRVGPAGAVLVLVGDVDPGAAVALAARALAGWDRPVARRRLPPPPALRPGPIELVPATGVRSLVRVAMDAVAPSDPDHPALELASLILAGYRSGRLVTNLRERQGIAYTVRSELLHGEASSKLVVSADVVPAATATAVLEIWYELGRLAVTPADPAELARARRYLEGSARVGMASQSGLADQLTWLAGHGLRPGWLAARAARLAEISVEEVAEVARRRLAPARAVTMVIGDADAVRGGLAALGPVRG